MVVKDHAINDYCVSKRFNPNRYLLSNYFLMDLIGNVYIPVYCKEALLLFKLEGKTFLWDRYLFLP